MHSRIQCGRLIIEGNDVRSNCFPSHQATSGQVNTIIQVIIDTTENCFPSISHLNLHILEEQSEEIVDNSIIKTSMVVLNFRHFFIQVGFNEEVKFVVALTIMKISRGQHG